MIKNKKIIALCLARIQDDATNAYITELHRAVAGMGYNIFVYNTCTAVGEDEFEEDVQKAVYEYINYVNYYTMFTYILKKYGKDYIMTLLNDFELQVQKTENEC